jgi:hypothetical protein
VQPGGPAIPLRALVRFGTEAVVAGSAPDLLVSAGPAGTRSATGVCSSFVEACLAAGLVSLASSAAVGFTSEALELRSNALCRSMKSLHVIGKTISPEAVSPMGLHPPGGGSLFPSDDFAGCCESTGWASPAIFIADKTDSVAAAVR